MPITTRGVTGNSVSTTTNEAGKTVGSARTVNEKGNPVNVGATRDAGRSLDNSGGRNQSFSILPLVTQRPPLGQGALSPATPPVTTPLPPSTPELTFDPVRGVWTNAGQAPAVPKASQVPQVLGLSQGDLQSWLLSLQNVSAPPTFNRTFDYLNYIQPFYRGGM